ncbi:MAG: hypothetical protein GF388_04625 [Candidatus Aegiribacteria sp.]|nr:hypothetical protein [Candidatus Aegiribacteria sp.]
MSHRILLLLIVLMCSTGVLAEWHDYVIEDYCYSPSLALDGAGSPMVVYSDHVVGVKYATFDGASWYTYPLYDISYGACANSDLYFDDDGTSHVSMDPAGATAYGYVDSTGEWVTEFLPSGSNDDWNSIALDSDGNPCIAFHDMVSDDFQFARRQGSSWEIEVVDAESDVGYCNSMMADDEGVMHVAYCQSGPEYSVRYAVRDIAGQWSIEEVDTSMYSDPEGTSLALDIWGDPHITYSASSELRYASLNGSSWTVETVYAMDTGAAVYGTSLAMDQYGYPHVAHCSATGDYLLYSVNQGGGWQTDSIANLGSVSDGDPDLALDELGRPHIAYESRYNGVNLRYIYNDESSGVEGDGFGEGSISLEAGPVPFSSSVRLVCTMPFGEDYTLRVFDLTGRLVREVSSGNAGSGLEEFYWQPGGSVPSGEYIAVLETEFGRTGRKLIYLR